MVGSILEHIRKGRILALYDGDEREGEVDIVFHPSFVTPERIALMRRDAGGLICLALDKRIADALGLPFYSRLLSGTGLAEIACKKTAYGDEPAFSIQVNHKKVFTGITDNDRALTIKEMAKLAGMPGEKAKTSFLENFYSPGHVFLLIGRGLEKRRGHTELAIELMKKSGLSGAAVLCEMLGEGKALPKRDAMLYARKNGLLFVEGRDIYE